jgi:hypothetical protein
MPKSMAAALSMAVGLALANTARAEDVFDYSLRALAGYTDNLNRTSANEESSGIYSIGGTLDYKQKSARLDANLASDLGYVVYSGSGADDRFVGDLVGDAVYSFVPDHFQWFASDNFGQGRLNEFQPSGPANEEAINYFSTGPRVYVNLSDRLQVLATGTYSNAWYQDSNGDSNQYGGGLSLIRILSGGSNVRIGANYQRIDYADPQFSPNVDTTSYFLGYRSAIGRTTITADAGYQHVDYGGQTSGDPLLRLTLNRQITPYSSLELQAGDVYNDGAGLMANDQSMPGNSASPGRYNNGQVFEDRYVGLAWGLDRVRTHLNLGVLYHDQNYIEDAQADLTRLDVLAGVSRDLSREWTIGADYYYWKEDYQAPGQDTDESNVGVFAAWQVSPSIELRGQWDYWWNSAATPGDDASENRFWVTFVWQPPGRRAARPADAPAPESEVLQQ